MKVKVSYSVDMEEVPILIDDLLSACRQKLTNGLEGMRPCLHNVPEMINRLEKVRATLSIVDSQLEDITGLAAGWYQTVNSPPDDSEIISEDLSVDEEEN